MRASVLLLIVAACTRGEPAETSTQPPAVTSAEPPAVAVRPSPPPPPPPPGPSPQPPPEAVAKFLAAHAADADAWQAFVFEVKPARSGGRFLGHTIVKRRSASAEQASELAARMGREASYVDGDIGCVGDPVGYRLSRGGATLDFIVDCGHLALDAEDDHAAILSSEMIEFLDRMRAAKTR